MELILESVFNESMAISSAPDVSLFKIFQQYWTFLSQTSYEAGVGDEAVATALKEVKKNIIEFSITQLREVQPRDDYREFLELVIIFLGGIPSRGVRFAMPGAIHHARWMANALYSLKIWMFHGQFKLNNKEERGLREGYVYFHCSCVCYGMVLGTSSCQCTNE